MKGKVVFEDLYSIHERPNVEKEFNSEESLNCWLREYGGFKYASKATIYVDDIPIITLQLSDRGRWIV